MKVESLELKGLLRFRDTIRLDFRELTGLVAVVGINGAGKTTLMEAPFGALYQMLPSRPDRKLFDYAQDRDSYITIDFVIDGRGLFRARLVLDAVGRKAEAVLQQIHADGLVTFLTDGKVTTYEKAIRELLPAPEVLLASAFAAQNRHGSFVTLDRKGKKELFALLLGLSHYEQMAETARKSAALVEQSRSRLVLMRDRLAVETGQSVSADLAQRAAALDEQRVHWTQERERLSARLATLDAAHGVAVERAAAHQTAVEQQRACLAALQDLERAIAAVGVEQGLAAKTNRDTLADIEVSRAKQAKDLLDRIQNNERLLADRERIDAAVMDLAAHTQAIEGLDASMRAIRQELAPIEREQEALRETVSGQEQFAYALQHAERDVSMRREVPCGGEGAFAACKFLINAAEAAKRVLDLQVKLQGAEMNAARLQQLTAQVTARREKLSALEAERDRAGRMLTTAAPIAAKASHLAEAETRLQERRAALARVEETAVEQRAIVEARHVAAELVLVARAAEFRTQVPALEAAVTAATAAVEPLADAATTLARLERDRVDGRAELAKADMQLAVLAAKVEAVERDRAALSKKQAEHAGVAQAVTTLDTELFDWQTLAKAFGREGLPTLEIDAAGPTVSGYCNELLEACFGGRFRVELVTQEAKAGGKGVKEAFSLQVYDHERGGGARDIADLSGGEQIIVDECLKSALAVYNNRRSQAPMRTCWRDETTGPLDPDNAARYLAMLRKLQQLAGFETIFFVSHNPDVSVTADAQIWVHDGTAEILYPPFGERQAA